MSSIAGTSIRALAGTVDGAFNASIRPRPLLAVPGPTTPGFVLGRYVSTPHRHEMIPLGIPTICAVISPRQDICAMRAKLAMLERRIWDPVPERQREGEVKAGSKL